jgi:hypothetical protein
LAPAGPLNVPVIPPKPYHLLLPVRVVSEICASDASRDQTASVSWDEMLPFALPAPANGPDVVGLFDDPTKGYGRR